MNLKRQDPNSENLFDREWERCISLFKAVVGINSLNINLTHPETRQPLKPHEGVAGTFEDWAKVESPWDRRSLIFEVIYQAIGRNLTPWQAASYLTYDRRPSDAFNLLEKASKGKISSQDAGPYSAALSKALASLTYYKDALDWAQKAVQLEPSNSHFQIILADAYFLCGQTTAADSIYSQRMATSSSSSSDSISDMFSEYFAIETGIVSSPIFAFQIGKSLTDATQAEEFWKLGEVEFYYSPHFRMEHAYYLGNTGRLERCFAKLLALVQEMPWVREANMNLLRLFEHFDPSGTNVMPEVQTELRERISQNGWTAEGMQEITLKAT